MYSVAAYYVVVASDIAGQHRGPTRHVANARPGRVTRLASAIAGLAHSRKPIAAQPT